MTAENEKLTPAETAAFAQKLAEFQKGLTNKERGTLITILAAARSAASDVAAYGAGEDAGGGLTQLNWVGGLTSPTAYSGTATSWTVAERNIGGGRN